MVYVCFSLQHQNMKLKHLDIRILRKKDIISPQDITSFSKHWGGIFIPLKGKKWAEGQFHELFNNVIS